MNDGRPFSARAASMAAVRSATLLPFSTRWTCQPYAAKRAERSLVKRQIGTAPEGDEVVGVEGDELASRRWPAREAASEETPSIRSPSLTRT